jgi:hypothetical protein
MLNGLFNFVGNKVLHNPVVAANLAIPDTFHDSLRFGMLKAFDRTIRTIPFTTLPKLDCRYTASGDDAKTSGKEFDLFLKSLDVGQDKVVSAQYRVRGTHYVVDFHAQDQKAMMRIAYIVDSDYAPKAPLKCPDSPEIIQGWLDTLTASATRLGAQTRPAAKTGTGLNAKDFTPAF